MSMNVATTEWENIVKKQLKAEDIYQALIKPNLEGITVLPYYAPGEETFSLLPKVEESTQLVAKYSGEADDNIYAYLAENFSEPLAGKTVYLLEDFNDLHSVPEETRLLLLKDFFDEKVGKFDIASAKYALEKPYFRQICVDISLHQNAGASMAQQLAISLAKAKDAAEFLDKDILKKVVVRLATGPNYFLEIAKIRALKLTFMQLAAEFDIDVIPYIFAETTRRNKTADDAENNLIRSTTEIASAMVGGADAVFSHDFKLEKTTGLSEEISFKQQILLAYESIINVFEDALAGSYFVEDVTRQLGQKAWQYFLEIEDHGGYTEAVKSGKIQQDIYNHAVEEQRWVEEGKIKLTSINLYPAKQPTKSIEELYNPQEIKPVRWAEMFE